tara:strand:+ start:184 stop:369 length:186 start_codon:yes stop_codon:yes gene_type:complete
LSLNLPGIFVISLPEIVLHLQRMRGVRKQHERLVIGLKPFFMGTLINKLPTKKFAYFSINF